MSYMPDFLTPPPGTLLPDLRDELDVLRATPAATVRADLATLGGLDRPVVAAMYADPRAGLDRLAAEIETYWRVAIAPDWARILAVLDAEVFYRSRRLAADGAAGLLNDLHHRVRWEGDTLSIAHEYCSDEAGTGGAGLLLVPSVFAWPSVLTVTAAEPRQLAYPARGVATLWECPSPTPEALAAVIGRSRALLLTELETPLSTTELARRTGLSPGGVSQHLGALRAAGLVVAHRNGHTVVNLRTPVAESLLLGAAR
jgi:biotin operon repressor